MLIKQQGNTENTNDAAEFCATIGGNQLTYMNFNHPKPQLD